MRKPPLIAYSPTCLPAYGTHSPISAPTPTHSRQPPPTVLGTLPLPGTPACTPQRRGRSGETLFRHSASLSAPAAGADEAGPAERCRRRRGPPGSNGKAPGLAPPSPRSPRASWRCSSVPARCSRRGGAVLGSAACDAAKLGSMILPQKDQPRRGRRRGLGCRCRCGGVVWVVPRAKT